MFMHVHMYMQVDMHMEVDDRCLPYKIHFFMIYYQYTCDLYTYFLYL